jgi:hypothetical protein
MKRKVRICKYLSDTFPVQDGLKQGHALSPQLFNCVLECAIREVQENQVVLKLNGTHQPLDCADDVNLLGYNLIEEEIKRRLNSGNACYHSVQNLFVFLSVQIILDSSEVITTVKYTTTGVKGSMDWIVYSIGQHYWTDQLDGVSACKNGANDGTPAGQNEDHRRHEGLAKMEDSSQEATDANPKR